jgi:uncharacterized phage infection (PIP) family protein YhgE
MAKSNIDRLQTNLKGTQDNLRLEQSKLQAANTDLKKTSEDLSASEAKLKETAQTLEGKLQELSSKSDQLATAQKEVSSQAEEISALKKSVEEGKLIVAELEKAKADVLATNEKFQAADLDRTELAKRVAQLEQDSRKGADSQPKDKPVAAKPDLLGLQGKILAVNPGWNFVVLNVGDQQGVLVNASLIVVRGNMPVARLRVTSVERSTSVADVIPSSMARGVSVQPGDAVIFEGRTPATTSAKPASEPVSAAGRAS